MFGGRYELGELIGYGGMAEVHRGRDLRLNRDVAIKVLRADLARDPSFLIRFRREAHAAAGLTHPAIVAVYDTGEETVADGAEQPYIIMEFVEGRTLRDILRSEGVLPARRAMEIAADVCGALDFSHRNGIVHRDIKPANVMITPAGAVKVMDFGIARAVADTSQTVTQTANVIGTAQYLSPEQARGETVDARSDVYSTGCLLYELVTGVPPFQGDSPVAVAYQHVRENPVLPSARNPEVPRVVDSIVMKALAKNTANRYQSAGDMRADLQRALANQPVAAEAVMTDAERTQFIARTPPPPIALPRGDGAAGEPANHRKAGLIWLGVVAALLVIIGVIAFLVVNNRGGGKQKVADVVVPQSGVIGVLPAAAEAKLTALRFHPISGGKTNGPCDGGATGEEGKVCKTSPAPGASVPQGSVVRYFTYSQKLVQVPDVSSDFQCKDALAKLEEAQLKGTCKQVNNAQKAGHVLSQNPPAYAQLKPGDTVTLTVSNGTVKLPDVTGLTFDQAKSQLNSQGFRNIVQPAPTTSTTDPKKAGKVASMNLTPKLAYPVTTEITLTVYKYKPPPSSPSCPPSNSSGSSGSNSSSGSASGSASSGSNAPNQPDCSSSSASSGSSASNN
jgi:serine/threonine-protein kinase